LRADIAHDRSQDLGEPTDDALVDRFRQGEGAALALLVRRHQKPLYNFALRQVRSGPAAEDVVQETFRRVVEGAESFERTGPFAAWLYKIARNLCVDALRHRAARAHQSLDDAGAASAQTTFSERTADPSADVERAVVAAEIRVRALAAIESLPDEQREVFLLREVCDLRFAEIAEVVSASENTVKSRMRYALERLQVALCDFAEYARELR
jgi:RNA polymerase sigma-70 factor (ECF subfamily)